MPVSAGAHGWFRVAGFPVPSLMGSTTSTSASPARCCRFRRHSGSGGASRSSECPPHQGFSTQGSCWSSRIWARFSCSTRTTATKVVGTPLDLVPGVDPTDATSRTSRLPAGPASLPGHAWRRSLRRRDGGARAVGTECRCAGAGGLGSRKGRVSPASGPATPSAADHWPARCCPRTARRSTSNRARSDDYGPEIAAMVNRNGLCRWTIWPRPRRRCRRTA